VGGGAHGGEGQFSGASLYSGAVLIGPAGAILNRHRRRGPTSPERMVWGQGDGSGLRVVDPPVGRVGGLICWENYMPLARFALYAQGPDFYLAPTWDAGSGWVSTMRYIALEGRCWVLGNGTAMRGRDVPETFPSRDALFPDLDDRVHPGRLVHRGPGRPHRRRSAPQRARHPVRRLRPGRRRGRPAHARRGRPLRAAGRVPAGGPRRPEPAADRRARRVGAPLHSPA